jgi:hypothetical protein
MERKDLIQHTSRAEEPHQGRAPLWRNAVAGLSGGFVSAVAMHPIDVVNTRLQVALCSCCYFCCRRECRVPVLPATADVRRGYCLSLRRCLLAVACTNTSHQIKSRTRIFVMKLDCTDLGAAVDLPCRCKTGSCRICQSIAQPCTVCKVLSNTRGSGAFTLVSTPIYLGRQ